MPAPEDGTASSDVNGDYKFPLLPAGKYKLVTERPGLESTVLSGIDLVVNQQAGLDISLELGEVTTRVEVDAAPPLVESTTANVGTIRNAASLSMTSTAKGVGQSVGIGFLGSSLKILSQSIGGAGQTNVSLSATAANF